SSSSIRCHTASILFRTIISSSNYSAYVCLFYSSRDLRELHSLPTRRSSDLAAHRLEAAPGPVGRLRGGDLCDPVCGVFRPLLPQDRKSTRLNSSHVSISYAVFCLKKKKE